MIYCYNYISQPPVFPVKKNVRAFRLMTDEIDVVKQAIMHYDRAVRLKKINEDLYHHLSGSIVWILKYSDKNQIPLPNKEGLCEMVTRAESLFQEIINSPLPPEPQQNEN
jgi:hypothetical protein